MYKQVNTLDTVTDKHLLFSIGDVQKPAEFNDGNGDDDDDFFSVRAKSSTEREAEEADYSAWLKDNPTPMFVLSHSLYFTQYFIHVMISLCLGANCYLMDSDYAVHLDSALGCNMKCAMRINSIMTEIIQVCCRQGGGTQRAERYRHYQCLICARAY